MKITLTSTGGFAGPVAPEKFSVDVDQLKEPERSRLQQAIRSIQPSADLGTQPRTSADLQHVLTVDDGGNPWTLKFHDGQASPQLARLIEMIRSAEA